MKTLLQIVPLLCAVLLPASAWADLPGRHPGYLHALSDLRAARWLLSHRPADSWVAGQESQAISEIDAALVDVRKAAIRDGKDPEFQPPPDMPRDRAGRFRRADEILRRVYHDLALPEDDPYTLGLRDRAIRHVDQAIRATDRAIVATGQ
jgi:hypothetical protein